MNTNVRYLVLNSKNEPQRPIDAGLHLPGLQGEKSPSFLSAESARLFAGALANAHKGQRFYLATVTAACVAFTQLDPAKQAEAGVEWSELA